MSSSSINKKKAGSLLPITLEIQEASMQLMKRYRAIDIAQVTLCTYGISTRPAYKSYNPRLGMWLT